MNIKKKNIYTAFILLVFLPTGVIQAKKHGDLIEVDTFSIDTFYQQNISGIASITLSKHRLEVNLLNSLAYNQKLYTFFSNPPSLTNDRQDLLTTRLQLTYGLSQNKNWNIGLDLNSSQIFYKPAIFPHQEFSVIKVGPRIRWRPFGSIGKSLDLVFQNAIYFKIRDSRNLLGNQLNISNQIFLFKYLLDKSIVLQAATGINIISRSSNNSFDRKTPLEVPFSIFAGFFARRDLIIFSYMNYINEFGTMPFDFEANYQIRRSDLNLAIGAQFTFNYRLSIYLIPQFSIVDKNGGAQNQISLGVRCIY